MYCAEAAARAGANRTAHASQYAGTYDKVTRHQRIDYDKSRKMLAFSRKVRLTRCERLVEALASASMTSRSCR